MIRKAAVAGLFYPDSKVGIDAQIDRFAAQAPDDPVEAFGVVVPHAGYRYSGGVAAKVFASIKMVETAVIMGPNHRGSGASGLPPKAAIVTKGEWEIPGGTVSIDEKLASLILEESEIVTEDIVAHEEEHSLEVQAPLIRRYHGDVKIVPLVLSGLTADEDLQLASDIYRAIKKYGKRVTLVASTDFSHYVSHDTATTQDQKAIDQILQLDGRGLLSVVREEGISMCGYNPVAVTVETCKMLGATKARLVQYATSGEVSGDFSSVVGYGGLIIA